MEYFFPGADIVLEDFPCLRIPGCIYEVHPSHCIKSYRIRPPISLSMYDTITVLQDKNFKKEMDRLMGSDEWKNGAEDAFKFLQDPAAMEALAKQVRFGVWCSVSGVSAFGALFVLVETTRLLRFVRSQGATTDELFDEQRGRRPHERLKIKQRQRSEDVSCF